MSRTVLAGTGNPYGMPQVCRDWRMARATVYLHRQPARSKPLRRPGATGPMADAALVAAIRTMLADSRSTAKGTQGLGEAAHEGGEKYPSGDGRLPLNAGLRQAAGHGQR